MTLCDFVGSGAVHTAESVLNGTLFCF